MTYSHPCGSRSKCQRCWTRTQYSPKLELSLRSGSTARPARPGSNFDPPILLELRHLLSYSYLPFWGQCFLCFPKTTRPGKGFPCSFFWSKWRKMLKQLMSILKKVLQPLRKEMRSVDKFLFSFYCCTKNWV